MSGPGSGAKAAETRRARESIEHHRQAAIAHLVRSAAALTDMPTVRNTGMALVWTAMAVLEIAKADPDESARAWAEDFIRSVRAEREGEDVEVQGEPPPETAGDETAPPVAGGAGVGLGGGHDAGDG